VLVGNATFVVDAVVVVGSTDLQVTSRADFFPRPLADEMGLLKVLSALCENGL